MEQDGIGSRKPATKPVGEKRSASQPPPRGDREGAAGAQRRGGGAAEGAAEGERAPQAVDAQPPQQQQPPPQPDAEEEVSEDEEAAQEEGFEPSGPHPGMPREWLIDAIPGLHDERYTQDYAAGRVVSLLAARAPPCSEEEQVLNGFYMAREKGKLKHLTLLASRSLVQQARVGLHAIVHYAEDALGLGSRELATPAGRSTHLHDMHAEDSGYVPSYPSDNVPPPAFRVDDESYEAHREAHHALCGVLLHVRSLAEQMEALCSLMDRTHDPARQDAEGKLLTVTWRDELLEDLYFMRPVPWSAVQRRDEVLGRELRTEVRRASAKQVASDQLVERQRAAAAEAAGGGRGRSEKKKSESRGEGGGRGKGRDASSPKRS